MIAWHFIDNFSHSLFSVYVITHEWIIDVIFNPFTWLKLDNHPEQLPEAIEVFHLKALLKPDQVEWQFTFFDIFESLHSNPWRVVWLVQCALVELILLLVECTVVFNVVIIPFELIHLIVCVEEGIGIVCGCRLVIVVFKVRVVEWELPMDTIIIMTAAILFFLVIFNRAWISRHHEVDAILQFDGDLGGLAAYVWHNWKMISAAVTLCAASFVRRLAVAFDVFDLLDWWCWVVVPTVADHLQWHRGC